MKQNAQQILTTAQTLDRNFLYELSNALSQCDLSNLDLKTLPGAHRAHSALFDNYELNITRTPVYVYKNGFARFMGFGEWKYQDGIFERYEIYILENAKNVRAHDILRYMDARPLNTHNIIMQTGTMATDRGCFVPTKQELTNNDDDMFYKQNAHLFVPAKQIYNILDGEYNRRQAQVRDYILSDVKSPHGLTIARNRMLNAVKTNQK